MTTAKDIQELAKNYSIGIDDAGPDTFGRLPSERIAGYFATKVSSDTARLAAIVEKMGQIQHIIDGERVSIIFPAKYAQNATGATIQADCITDAVRSAMVEGIYSTIQKDLFTSYFGRDMIRHIEQGGKPYEDRRLWAQSKKLVEDAIGSYKSISKAEQARQKQAALFIWGLIPKDTEGKAAAGATKAYCFIYKILLDAGLIANTEESRNRTNREMRDYIQGYLK